MAEWDYMDEKPGKGNAGCSFGDGLFTAVLMTIQTQQQEDENQWITVMKYENFLISHL